MLRILVILVAIAALPVSQLRTIAQVVTCCCPDASRCHCPDHQPNHSGTAKLEKCHKSSHTIESAAPDNVVPPPPPSVGEPPRIALGFAHDLPSAHAPPAPARPPGPS